MKTINKFSAGVTCLLFAAACTYDFPEETNKPTQGTADFTKMISVGNSLTAGFMNGALYPESQNNSFVSIIANQMKEVGGSATFNQPTVTGPNGCSNPGGGCTAGRLYLKLSSCNPGTVPPTPGPSPKVGDGGTSFAFTGNKAELNNFGVPGVTLGSSLSTALSASPYYARIASDPGNSTLIGDAATALANGGTFFTFWLGNNDILGYATEGATGAYTPADDSPGGFETLFNLALNAMLNANPEASGAVANIPNVTSIPYFSTINPLAFNVPACSRPALLAGINQLNAAINGWNAGVNGNGGLTEAQKAALRRPTLSTNFDAYALIVYDGTLSDAEVPDGMGGTYVIPKIRNNVAADGLMICLKAGSDPSGLPGGMGISPANPIVEANHDKFYLTPAEKTEIQGVVDAYNDIIETIVEGHSDRLVLVDANAALTRIKETAVTIKGSSLTATITPPNGAFSLDGVHPNARGSAYIANEFIKAINAKFGSTIPLCNPNSFGGNELPVP